MFESKPEWAVLFGHLLDQEKSTFTSGVARAAFNLVICDTKNPTRLLCLHIPKWQSTDYLRTYQAIMSIYKGSNQTLTTHMLVFIFSVATAWQLKFNGPAQEFLPMGKYSNKGNNYVTFWLRIGAQCWLCVRRAVDRFIGGLQNGTASS